jgi:AsmA protein
MGRIVKVIGLVIGALIVLLVVVLAGVALFFDPNDYKDEITVAVDNATGRTLTLEGDLSLSVFPRLSIALGAAELSNGAGFGDAPFARFDSAELRVGLLPLLARRIEVDRAVLSGLRLNLARDAQGRTNWEDLGAGGGGANVAAAETPEAGGGGAADLDISVGAVQILDAEVTWRDAAAGQDWTLSNFNLRASDFNPGRPFPLAIGFDLAGAEVSVSVEAEMQALVELAANRYRLDDLRVDLEGEGPGWPGGSGEASLKFASFDANLDAQTVALEELELEMLGMTVHGNLTGEDLLDDLSLSGGIEIDEFDPRDLMAAFDTAIETADPDVLGRASARAQFYFDSSAMGMRDMALSLDDSTLSGSAGLRGERVEFDLTVDAIDIDRYLPPPADDEDVPADTGSVDEIDLPIDPLRNFSAMGNLALNETKFLGMTLNNANFALAAGNGRMTLTPTGRLYGGTLDGQITIQVQGNDARLALRSSLANIDMAGFASDYLKIDTLAGTGNVTLDLAATGAKVGTIKRDLDGRASVAITDGALLGIDIWQEIMELRARATGPDAPAPQEPVQTVFSRIAIGGPVEDAVLTTEEFSAVLPFAALTGSGTVDLLTTELALRANAGLVDGPTLQQDPVLAAYAGRQMPLTISGTLAAPRVLPDIQGLLSQAVQQRVQEEVDEARDDAEERVRDRLRNLIDR